MTAVNGFVIYFPFYFLSNNTDSLLSGYPCTLDILYFLQTDDFLFSVQKDIYTSGKRKLCITKCNITIMSAYVFHIGCLSYRVSRVPFAGIFAHIDSTIEMLTAYDTVLRPCSNISFYSFELRVIPSHFSKTMHHHILHKL